MTFAAAVATEWRRLTPSFCSPGDSYWQTFAHAVREGWYGYWAFWRLTWWLLRGGWR